MDQDRLVVFKLYTDLESINVTWEQGWTAEDICIKICKELGIGPIARYLFAIRNRSTKYWYHPSHKFEFKDKQKYEFRLRFKPFTIIYLKQLDAKAYDYYFQQVKNDILENKVPEIIYEKHKQELIGLGVTDMYRVMLEKGISRETVECDYKKYIPKECIKRHSIFIKKPIHNALCQISGHNISFVKEQYLSQFESMAPNYLSEEYKAVIIYGLSNLSTRILIRVTSKEAEYCEIDSSNCKWQLLFTLEDLCFISIRLDNELEILQKKNLPYYIKFNSIVALLSFVSALDGLYRLQINGSLNLCAEAVTPSLKRMHQMKCHGPIGAKYSHSKLIKNSANLHGAFIIRENEKDYDKYFLDYYGKDGKIHTKCMEKLPSGEFMFSETFKKYKSIHDIIESYKNPKDELYLNHFVPFTEYEKSPILICFPIEHLNNTAKIITEETIAVDDLEERPCCIFPEELEIFKNLPFQKSEQNKVPNKDSNFNAEVLTYKALWKYKQKSQVETVVKLFKEEQTTVQTKEFLKLAQKWGELSSNALVRLYGITLDPDVGMVFEYIRLGPLDEYLKNNLQTLKNVDLVEAAACLATAVWHLEEHGIVHGYIRCHKLLVHSHTDNCFSVKLTDPGLFSYKPSDVHWVPPECYANPDSARHNMEADIWAVGTVLWQIFSREVYLPSKGNIDIIRRFYAGGKRLPMTNKCPPEIYKIIKECWGEADTPRKQPQSIMRDIHQIKLQLYSTKRTHAYTAAFPKRFNDTKPSTSKQEDEMDVTNSDSESRSSSIFTDNTILPWDDYDENTGKFDWSSVQFQDDDNDDATSYLDWFSKTSGNINGDERYDDGWLGQMQSIFELDANCNVILQGRIGQGFYGEVYLGTLEKDSSKDSELQQVAVKKLKMRALEADLRDFEREINIMKTLKHPNIVEILGVIPEPEVCLVMEFVRRGSLQSYLSIHRESLTHKRLLGFALDIATGMKYLGCKNIVHRDLAARNILVSEDNHAKISDFGLAQVTEKNDYYILQTNRDLPIKWYAPESLRDGKFSTKSDVWSFGVTMYETFSFGEDPKLSEFVNILENKNVSKETNIAKPDVKEEGSADLLKALERGARLPCPTSCPQEIYVKIMYPCWNFDSVQRPDFSKLIRDIKVLMEGY